MCSGPLLVQQQGIGGRINDRLKDLPEFSVNEERLPVSALYNYASDFLSESSKPG